MDHDIFNASPGGLNQADIQSCTNVFVVGLDPFNLELLRTVGGEDEYRFIGLLDYSEVVHPARDGYPSLEVMLDQALAQLNAFPGSVDAVIGYWDFPTSALVPLISQQLGLPGPSLEAVTRTMHKYWSRIEQCKVLPEMTPRFQVIDPFAADPGQGLELEYPLWLKPVKSHSSFLGFFIDSAETLRERLATIRDKIGIIARPFNEFLAHVELPADVAVVDGYYCIAEEIISAGHQCTLEGYSRNGTVHCVGIVDSIRSGRQQSCFSRYQYPSSLPANVRERMLGAAERVVRHLDYDNAAFNIEFYWNPEDDRIRLLEINNRISKSHSPLFLMVDGATNQKISVDLALDRDPDFPHRSGMHRLAAKFMLRLYEDAVVERVPSGDDLKRLRAACPEARFRTLATEGMRLGQLPLQDSYSYEYGELFLGAKNQDELLEKYRRCLHHLGFRFRSLETAT